MTEPIYWSEIAPEDANKAIEAGIDIIYPVNELGEPCKWPWEPQQLKGAPLGQYHCSYCGGMEMAGLPHSDYKDFDEIYIKWVEEQDEKHHDEIDDGISV